LCSRARAVATAGSGVEPEKRVAVSAAPVPAPPRWAPRKNTGDAADNECRTAVVGVGGSGDGGRGNRPQVAAECRCVGFWASMELGYFFRMLYVLLCAAAGDLGAAAPKTRSWARALFRRARWQSAAGQVPATPAAQQARDTSLWVKTSLWLALHGREECGAPPPLGRLDTTGAAGLVLPSGATQWKGRSSPPTTSPTFDFRRPIKSCERARGGGGLGGGGSCPHSIALLVCVCESRETQRRLPSPTRIAVRVGAAAGIRQCGVGEQQRPKAPEPLP
jgi:hypothetical protein